MSADDVYDLLEELSYPQLEEINFDHLPLAQFGSILYWISKQLHYFAKTDSIVQAIQDASDLDSLKVELNSLLQEVGSIYHNQFKRDTLEDRLVIVYNLAGHLIASRLSYLQTAQNDSSVQEIESSELNPRKDLNFIKNILEIGDESKDVATFFGKVNDKLKNSFLKAREEDSLLLPAQHGELTCKEWCELKQLNTQLRQEYELRREMMLRRADTTVNSFTWKNDPSRQIDANKIREIYAQQRQRLSSTPGVTLAHALAARSSDCCALVNDVISTNHASCLIDRPQIQATANRGAQQRLQLHKFLIGNVPDRGGRPTEAPIPAKQTIQQQRQQRDHSQRRGGGRGGGGGQFNNRNAPDYNRGKGGAHADNLNGHRSHQGDRSAQHGGHPGGGRGGRRGDGRGYY